jgi:hypothetical protein
MIREKSREERTMAGLSVARVEPVSRGVHEAHWSSGGGRHGSQRRPARPGVRRQVIAAVLPGRDPEVCELFCDVGADGELTGLLILDAATGEPLARLTLAQLEDIGSRTDARGLFFERRG